MIRGFVLLLIVGILFSVSGCMMSEVMGAKQEKLVSYEQKPDLNVNENHSLRTWFQAAALADDVGDCTTSMLYYMKIVDYFPDTKEGVKAQMRLDEISGKPDVAVKESSL
ncbi:MAG: hypothetical protein KAS13_08630 [Candidatus Omnitrophica bacterium]|nr:hypothetical protein [Candidatus Omnitrophota bacterium]